MKWGSISEFALALNGLNIFCLLPGILWYDKSEVFCENVAAFSTQLRVWQLSEYIVGFIDGTFKMGKEERT